MRLQQFKGLQIIINNLIWQNCKAQIIKNVHLQYMKTKDYVILNDQHYSCYLRNN